MNEVDSYLTLDINEKELATIYNQIKDAEAELVEAQVKLNKLQQDRSSINATVIAKTAEYNRDVESYLQKIELQDDGDRLLKYSNMALQIIDPAWLLLVLTHT